MYATVKLDRFLIAVVCWAVTLSIPALAQSVAGGLFGATRANTTGRDELDVVLSISESLDSDVPFELNSLVPRKDLQIGGLSTSLAASADYARTRKGLQLFSIASTYFRYGHRRGRFDPGTQNAQLGVGVRLPKQGHLQMSQSVTYSPSYLYLLLPTAAPPAVGEPVPVNPEFQIDQTESYSHHSQMTLAFGSVRGTRLTTTAKYGRTDFKSPIVEGRNLETYSAGTRVSHAMSRTSALSVGYEFIDRRFDLLGSSKEHRGTIGVEYRPVLSVSRRATLRLEVSSSRFDIPASTLDGIIASAVAQRVHPLQGEAIVDYPFRLKWKAGASYRRGVDLVPGMTEPMLTNGSRMRLAGVIGRRVVVSALAGSATATSTISRDNRNFRTYTGEARFTYALTRSFALYSAYSYFYYDVRGRSIVSSLPDIYQQHGIRIGLMIFAQPVAK